MKYGNRFYIQASREIWKRNLSDNAILLYFWMKELESRYTGKNKTYFTHTNAELAAELHWDIGRLKQAKKELFTAGIIQVEKLWKDGKPVSKITVLL